MLFYEEGGNWEEVLWTESHWGTSQGGGCLRGRTARGCNVHLSWLGPDAHPSLGFFC